MEILTINISQVSWAWWWCTTIILALERLRQEDGKFEASLGYIASSRQAWAT
jgi:hypothetical protein